MTCKNCTYILNAGDQFCNSCGAKVVKERITLKKLLMEMVSNVFGFDTKYLITLKMMILNPKEVLEDYLSGVRKKYVNPFAFLAIGTAISLLIFNIFPESFIEIQSNIGGKGIAELRVLANQDLAALEGISEKELKQLKIRQNSAKTQLLFQDNFMRVFLKYFNIMAFVFLIFYALLSKWTYKKPYNLGEHIVINAFTQGVTMWFTLLMFCLSLMISPSFYIYSTLLMFIYYWYVLSRLHDISFGKSIVKFFRFLLVLMMISLLFFIVGVILAFIIILINKTI